MSSWYPVSSCSASSCPPEKTLRGLLMKVWCPDSWETSSFLLSLVGLLIWAAADWSHVGRGGWCSSCSILMADDCRQVTHGLENKSLLVFLSQRPKNKLLPFSILHLFSLLFSTSAGKSSNLTSSVFLKLFLSSVAGLPVLLPVSPPPPSLFCDGGQVRRAGRTGCAPEVGPNVDAGDGPDVAHLCKQRKKLISLKLINSKSIVGNIEATTKDRCEVSEEN